MRTLEKPDPKKTKADLPKVQKAVATPRTSPTKKIKKKSNVADTKSPRQRLRSGIKKK